MKETEWLKKKEYKKFLKHNKFVRIHKTQFKCECFCRETNKRLNLERGERVSNMKFVEYFKLVYSNIELKEIA